MSPNDQNAALPPRRLPRHWLAYTIVGLLIVVPLIYLYISAMQSRDSGRDKAEKAGASTLTDEWPSRVQRRIYQVPIPARAGTVRFYETNSWKSSSLFVEFNTSPVKLGSFLKNAGSAESELKEGYVPITEEQAEVVGWNFDDGRTWHGVLVDRPDPGPDVAIAVSYDRVNHPAVRVVSTTEL